MSFFLLETISKVRARGIDGKVDVPGPLIAVPKVYPAKADNKYGKLFPAKAAPSPVSRNKTQEEREMSNAAAVAKQLVGAQVVTGTLEAMTANKPGSSKSLAGSMESTAKLTEDVVGGSLLGPYAKTSSGSDLTGEKVDSSLINYKG